jgi:hypothetical protein
MNSQIDLMVLVVEGSRGPPIRKKKVVALVFTAIIKIHNTQQLYLTGGTKMETTIKSKFWMTSTPPPNHTETDRAPPAQNKSLASSSSHSSVKLSACPLIRTPKT